MYLMDNIAEIAQETIKRKELAHPIVGVFPMLYDELQGCPRFIFDEKAIATAVELTLGRPKILYDSIMNMRIPYPKLWVEWPETGRARLREVFTPNETINPLRPLPDKIGFLLRTDETGRKGVVYWAWNVPKDLDYKLNPPNVCPISPYFDLDKDHPQHEALLTTFIRANIANIWKDNPVQLDALLKIWRTAEHMPSVPWGTRYMRDLCGSDEKAWFYRTNHFYADVYGEYIMVWAILLLLTSSRKIIEETKIDLSGLNKARVKRKQIPKLDYTRVNMYINPEAHHIKFIRGPLDHTRKSPRIHMVSSFLNRRGDKHWVVQPFWRGQGEMVNRHIHVHDKPKGK